MATKKEKAAKTKKVEKVRKVKRKESDLPASTNKHCCCGPSARVWIEIDSVGITVENKTDVKRHLETHSASKAHPDISVNANANAIPNVNTRVTTTASVQPPGGPPVSADSVGAAVSDAKADSGSDADAKVDSDSDSDTVIDEIVGRDQGKVYRTDRYTVHWLAEGLGAMSVSLRLWGALNQDLAWLPPSGSLKLVRSHLLEPPDYEPRDVLELFAELVVEDCTHASARHTAISARA